MKKLVRYTLERFERIRNICLLKSVRAQATCQKELLRTTNWHQLWKLLMNGSEVTPVLKRVILQSEKIRPTWLQK